MIITIIAFLWSDGLFDSKLDRDSQKIKESFITSLRKLKKKAKYLLCFLQPQNFQQGSQVADSNILVKLYYYLYKQKLFL